MMKNLSKCILFIVILAACFVPRMGLGALIGQPAPALNVSAWLKGGPIEFKPGTNIYVLEIWETKRPACQASITNLNLIQSFFKTNGVVVLTVSDEPTNLIQAFIDQQGANIQFAVAGDNKRHTSLEYMKPINQMVVPYVFIIGTNGDLLWHGRPDYKLPNALSLIISGKYDESFAKNLDVGRHQMEQYLTLARQGSDRTKMAGQIMLAARTNDVFMLCDMAQIIATYPKLVVRDFALANEALDQAETISANSPTNNVKVQMTRAIVLFESGQRDEALAKAKALLDSAQNPYEKTNFQALVQNMQNRILVKAVKSDGASPAATTNQPPAHAGNP